MKPQARVKQGKGLRTTVYLLIAAAVLLGIAMYSPLLKTPALEDGKPARVKVDRAKLEVQVVGNDQSRSRGLAGTPSLDESHGMLFLFPSAQQPAIWMKGVQYPIDIIWINNGTVIEVTPNVPPVAAGTPDAAMPLYQPAGVVTQVLEVAAGWAARNNVQPGDPLRVLR